MEFTSHKSGTFCWADLATSDTAGAKDFYGKIFGLVPFEMPTEAGMPYTMLNIQNKPAAALYDLAPEHKAMNIPPHWMNYVSCDDIKATVQKVKDNGGVVIMEPWEAAGYGIGAMFQDPEGAMLGLWQPISHIGASWKNIHGAYCWFEHASHGNEKTVEFYENVFGYSARTELMGDTLYTTFFLGEEPVAGLYVMPEMLKDLPCHWLVYFTVDSVDKALEVTIAEKGEILMPKMQVPGVGFFSVIRDPQGAVLGIVEGEK